MLFKTSFPSLSFFNLFISLSALRIVLWIPSRIPFPTSFLFSNYVFRTKTSKQGLLFRPLHIFPFQIFFQYLHYNSPISYRNHFFPINPNCKIPLICSPINFQHKLDAVIFFPSKFKDEQVVLKLNKNI